MEGRFSNVRICAMASAVPTYIEPNSAYLEVLGERRLKRQTRMTGVEQRRINDKHQTTADLCLAAANKVLEKTGWGKEEIQVLVLVTQSPSVYIPSTSFILHKQLGLSKDCMVYDVNLGCSGFVAGLQIVASMLQTSGLGAKGILLAGDIQRGTRDGVEVEDLSPDERADQMLFGSAGTATAIELVADSTMCFMEKSDGNGYEAIIQRYHETCVMDGEKVFNFGVNDVIQYLKEFEDKFQIGDSDIDYYVFHQAQKFMLQNMANLLEIPMEKVPMSLKNFGNTSSASIPLTICAGIEEMQKIEKQRLLLCGFGIGLACGVVYLELDTDAILPVIETDEIHEF